MRTGGYVRRGSRPRVSGDARVPPTAVPKKPRFGAPAASSKCRCRTGQTSPDTALAGSSGPEPASVRTLEEMSVAESPDEASHLTVVTPKEALRRALPLPTDDEMAIEGVTDEEWDAFEHALADR